MAVRVPVEISRAKGGRRGVSVRSAAVVNTGFESDRPEILVPLRLAESLGLYPRVPRAARMHSYSTPAGEFRVIRIARALLVRLNVRGRKTRPARADAVLSEQEREPLLNDVLAGALGIVILNPASGEWLVRGERFDFPRRSARPSMWGG